MELKEGESVKYSLKVVIRYESKIEVLCPYCVQQAIVEYNQKAKDKYKVKIVEVEEI